MALAGARPPGSVIDRLEELTVNEIELETRPPVFVTEINAGPAVVSRLAGISAINVVEFVKPVVSACGEPPTLHCATEVLLKLLPAIVIEVDGSPAVAWLGVAEVMDGADGAAEVTVNVTALEITGPGFCTLMKTEPGLVIRSVYGTIARSWLELSNAVDNAAGDPVPVSQSTCAPVAKLLPVTSIWNVDAWAAAEAGARPPELMVGCAWIVKVSAFEMTPPVLATFTNAMPPLASRAAGTSAPS